MDSSWAFLNKKKSRPAASAFFHDTIIHGIFPQIVPLFGQFAVADNSDLRYNEVGP